MTRRRNRTEGTAKEGPPATQGTPETERGTSWIGVVIGTLTALGAALLLSGIVGGIVTLLVLALLSNGGSETGVAVSSLVGVLATLFLAYLIGGYAAGRVASRKGTKHGLLAALLGVLLTVLLVTTGAILGVSISDNLSGVVLPDVATDEQQGLGSILALSAISGVLVLVMPFIGGAIGGPWGARTGRRRP